MTVKIKICGNTSLEDARVATEAGADMLGFIFYERSPRSVTVEQATAIVAGLREAYGEKAPAMVGVFVDERVKDVQATIDAVGLDLVQLHGSEPPVEMKQLAPVAFKVIRPQNRGDAEAMVATYGDVLVDQPEAPHFLFDTYHPWRIGGTGHTSDWVAAQVVARRFKILLAGGLTPENVAVAIQKVQPWGVDVASGVERSPGVKDPEKLKAFIRTARQAPAPRERSVD